MARFTTSEDEMQRHTYLAVLFGAALLAPEGEEAPVHAEPETEVGLTNAGRKRTKGAATPK